MQPPRPTIDDVIRDLSAEQEALDAVVASLDEAAWEVPTPSPRWAIRDQIGHLAYFDATAALAITDPEAFAAHRSELFGVPTAGDSDEDGGDAATLGAFRAMSATELLDIWRQNRSRLASAAGTLGERDRVEWYGPSMGSKSFLTARLMEVWAHGQDVLDTVGRSRPATDRLLHIAQLGVITRGWSYVVRGAEVPDGEVAVALEAPSGATWNWGGAGADDRVSGPAEDFCLVVTQRRHIDDTALTVVGDLAHEWMTQAQAFAGGPTSGPEASAVKD